MTTETMTIRCQCGMTIATIRIDAVVRTITLRCTKCARERVIRPHRNSKKEVAISAR